MFEYVTPSVPQTGLYSNVVKHLVLQAVYSGAAVVVVVDSAWRATLAGEPKVNWTMVKAENLRLSLII